MQNRTKRITLVGLFIALCILIPIIFHMFGLGKMFLPMFLPILLAAFTIQYPGALFVGTLGPLVSSLSTGMPPLFPMALSMSIEGLVTAWAASYLYFRRNISFWICLITAVLFQRIARVLMLLLILPLFGLPVKSVTLADFTYSFPGVILQLAIVPIIMRVLWKFNIAKRGG